MPTIYNLGSMNLDHVYRVRRFVAPGETMAVEDYQVHLGGKGLNHSVALARGGANVVHVGCFPEHQLDQFAPAHHANLSWHIQPSDVPAGHAIIQVDNSGENQILLYPGANQALTFEHIQRLDLDLGLGPGDWMLAQNETNLVSQSLGWAKTRGAKIAYAAAPFDALEVQAVLPFVDVLAMNQIEAQQLENALGQSITALGIGIVLVTHGAQGVTVHHQNTSVHMPAFAAQPIDTTGAGDCFFGSFLSQLVQGAQLDTAVRFAQAAAAIKVSRQGAAVSFPNHYDVESFLNDQ